MEPSSAANPPVIDNLKIEKGSQLPGTAQKVSFDMSDASLQIDGDIVCSARGGEMKKISNQPPYVVNYSFTYKPQKTSTCRIILTYTSEDRKITSKTTKNFVLTVK